MRKKEKAYSHSLLLMGGFTLKQFLPFFPGLYLNVNDTDKCRFEGNRLFLEDSTSPNSYITFFVILSAVVIMIRWCGHVTSTLSLAKVRWCHSSVESPSSFYKHIPLSSQICVQTPLLVILYWFLNITKVKKKDKIGRGKHD